MDEIGKFKVTKALDADDSGFLQGCEYEQSRSAGPRNRFGARDAEQDAAPQIRPRWWVVSLTGYGDVVELVKAR